MKHLARFVPVATQLVGAFAISFGIGALFGWAIASITVGVGLLASGTLAEIDARKTSKG